MMLHQYTVYFNVVLQYAFIIFSRCAFAAEAAAVVVLVVVGGIIGKRPDKRKGLAYYLTGIHYPVEALGWMD